MNSATLVQKLWNYCNVLRDDGMSYGDYVEQLTYLLFLKMADERSRPPYIQDDIGQRGRSDVPGGDSAARVNIGDTPRLMLLATHNSNEHR